LQIEPNIVLTSDISDLATGEILATWRVNGEKGEDIFSVIDKLTAQIKTDLSLPSVTKKGLEKSVADVTTHSPEAYRYYLEGLDNYSKVYFVEAAKSFEKAFEYDSTFAMAYFRLAIVNQGEKRKKYITKALQYSDNISKKEKFYIKILAAGTSGNTKDYSEGLQKMTEYFPDDKEPFQWLASYYYQIQQNDLAITYFNRALEIDPLDKPVLNMLAYAYNQAGDFDKSIWAINKYISVAPDEANPYDTRGDLYAWNGRVTQAMESYRKAIEKKPDFFASWRKLGHMHLFTREYAEADSCYKVLTASDQKAIRSEGRVCLAYIPAYQGKFEDAIRLLDEGLAADRMEQAEGEYTARKHSLKGLVYLEEKRGDLARQEAEKVVETSRKIYPESKISGRQHYVYVLAANGELEKARQVAQALKNDIGKEEEGNICFFWYAEGCIDFFKGDFEKSIVNLEKAVEHIDQLYAHFMLARAYLESGKLDKAVSQLENILTKYNESRAGTGIWAVKAHYLLGLAYEKSGWNSKAAEQFDEFLKIWKNADPGIPEIKDAKERLTRLKSRA
ncbi:MAG: tetratricopeptide repeat protein, partial [Methanothrix sp.]